ncbi:calcium activated cation channel [Peniophora sp. CONT]|nr:calcium activated cation channel [Peniophora sp. CONT]
MDPMQAEADTPSLASVHSIKPTPDTIARLVQRLRSLTYTLLPLEVAPASINDPTSRVITPEVIATYMAAAGDLTEALPYCLLRARADFMKMANSDAADYDENLGRATACEVLARRIVHKAPSDKWATLLSTRYKYRHSDGDIEVASALEVAIDTHCLVFLSSNETQDVVNWLWKGEIVMEYHDDHDVDFVPFDAKEAKRSFWGHFDPARMAVPRYQNAFRIAVWFVLLVVYSQAVQQPLDRADPTLGTELDPWEIFLYVLGLSFAIEELHKWWKLLRFATWRAFGFWNIVSFIIDGLFVAGFVLRVAGILSNGPQHDILRLRSFQVLSYAAPLLWMKLVTVFDGYKYIGTMQICVARMLRESGIFFALLSILGIGFLQALYALDASDGVSESPIEVVHVMVQALLGSPNFDKFEDSAMGMLLYYFWNIVTAVILLNVLISLFSSAYDDVVDDAEAEFLAYFAGKTVGMVRSPDVFVYPAPFNIFEVFLVAPLERVMSRPAYALLNRIVLTVVLFIPLAIIALIEARLQSPHTWMNGTAGIDTEDDDAQPEARDPPASDDGLVISRVPYKELITVFPNTHESSEASILREIRALKEQLDGLTKLLEQKS